VPTLFEKLTEGRGRGAVHQQLNIVIRRIRPIVGIDPARVSGQVIGSVPSAVGDIESAGEGDGVVDNDDFLMEGCAQGMAAVE